MLALGIIFTTIGGFLLITYFILLISIDIMTLSLFNAVGNISNSMISSNFFDKTDILIDYSLKFLLPGVIFLILGIIFIKIGNKKILKKQQQLNKENEKRMRLQKQAQELKRKELESKTNNFINKNSNIYCAYCGAKLKNDALKCENCGGVIRKE